jgi:3-methyl-2-oxobutanoate hydroxymethyltransferase
MANEPIAASKLTVRDFHRKKAKAEPITMLTAYDCTTARLIDRSGIDSILVGDSLGMVVLGYDTTLPVTMDDMLRHCQAVARGASRALLIGDMPFLSYQVSPAEAVRNAGRFLQKGGMDAVKLEGGREMLPAIQAILAAGIPLLGHLGLTPQSVHKFGGMRAQGKTAAAAKQILDDALLLERAGVFGIVLEAVPVCVARLISQRLAIPTIGIGAGAGCDGQVLVVNDMLGLNDQHTPRFVRKYANLVSEMERAFSEYRDEVIGRAFPAPEHEIEILDDEWKQLLTLLEGAS